MPKGIYKHKPRISIYPLKSRLHCTTCHYVWQYKEVSSFTQCPLCGKKIDARDMSEYTRWHYKLHPEREDKFKAWAKGFTKERTAKARLNRKKRVLVLISKSRIPKCVSCSCDDIRLLEVNHKNGGGNKEYKTRPREFQLDVIMFRRSFDDLEVMCRVCNAKHYLELKYGKLPFAVKWKGQPTY